MSTDDMFEMLNHITTLATEAMLDCVGKPGEEDKAPILEKALGEIEEIVNSISKVERKHWLELPRGVTLQRFVNTKRETHFIGQYRSDDKSNQNPRRVYTIDVLPMWDDGEDEDLKLSKAFEVGVHEDGKLLFKITTFRGRANAEYLGVKALKAWLDRLNRKGKESVKAQRKRHHKAHRAEYRKRYKANLKARKAARKAEATYFTPPKVLDEVERKHTIDPACGTGAFLNGKEDEK